MPSTRIPNSPVAVAVVAWVALSAVVAVPVRAQFRDPADAPPPPAKSDGSIRNTAYHYSSEEGFFQVTWPAGCGELRIRANQPDEWAGEDEQSIVLVHQVSCDRFGLEGEGCSVTASFDVKNGTGGDAGPPEVLKRVRNMLKKFGVKVVRQDPVRREFPDGLVVEGIDVFGTSADGEGEFRVRGVLSSHDIYLQAAWSLKGEVWENPAFVEFFESFVPYVE